MVDPELSREWQKRQHERILRGDPVAFSELCEWVLPQLVSFLRAQFPHCEVHLHEMIAIDCLLSYRERPRQFDPGRLALLAYLRMAARRDMLNEIDKNRRREKHLLSLDDPVTQSRILSTNHLIHDEEPLSEQMQLDDWLRQHTELTSQEILESLDAEFDPVDQAVLLLMFEGVRETARYAETMGIRHQDELSQRREVKRAKDRLVKRLQRFGQQIDNS
jgi:RNA polymerase sigma-70 factor (ECF subfamily)